MEDESLVSVRPEWPIENLRRTIAFQIGVHPHQLSVKVDGAQLLGGRQLRRRSTQRSDGDTDSRFSPEFRL